MNTVVRWRSHHHRVCIENSVIASEEYIYMDRIIDHSNIKKEQRFERRSGACILLGPFLSFISPQANQLTWEYNGNCSMGKKKSNEEAKTGESKKRSVCTC